MLRGMGWEKGQAIGGTNKGLTVPIEFIPRSQGLGLGAERRHEQSDKKRRRKPGDAKSSQVFGYSSHSYCNSVSFLTSCSVIFSCVYSLYLFLRVLDPSLKRMVKFGILKVWMKKYLINHIKVYCVV